MMMIVDGSAGVKSVEDDYYFVVVVLNVIESSHRLVRIHVALLLFPFPMVTIRWVIHTVIHTLHYEQVTVFLIQGNHP
jgi:hypothetical protein